MAFLFLRYLSNNYEAAAKKELGPDYPTLTDEDKRSPLAVWYANNQADIPEFEKQMRRKVGMEEIEQNDFNLNISRYVSTAEAEEEIDLPSVHAELARLEQARKAALDKHNAFLKELGLPLLP